MSTKASSKYIHPYSMKGFSGTVLPYAYFNAKTDAEAIEAAINLRRAEHSKNQQSKWLRSLFDTFRPTVENNKTGFCWPYCAERDYAWVCYFIEPVNNTEEKEKFERAIIEILCHRSNVQRQQICITYTKLYQKDMLEELKTCLSGDIQEAVYALVTDPVVYDCEMLHRALHDGLTIDGELLAEIVCSRTNVQLMAIQEKYAHMYGDPRDKIDNGPISLETLANNGGEDTAVPPPLYGQPQTLFKDITKIFTEARMMQDREHSIEFVQKVLIDAYHREWSPKMSPSDRDDETRWDERLARTDAGELYGAGEFKWGTDEDGFVKILFQQNITFAQLRATFDAYKRLYGKSLLDVVKEEFSGTLRELISTYVASIESRQEFFATQMYEAMRGIGTDDDQLIRNVVTRCEVDMVQIKLCYKDLYGKTVKEAIDDDTSGTYGDLLLALVGPGPT